MVPKVPLQLQWQHSKIVNAGIDKTRLVISDAPSGLVPFSFMVMGDTDSGPLHQDDLAPFTTAFADQFIQHLEDSRFLIHTGDVTYPIGSYQNYLKGFLEPYRSLLSHLPSTPNYQADEVIFNRPVLPVPGNHDYADLPLGSRLWQGLLRRVCDRLRPLGIDLGHYGGQGGEAYAKTFLDDLQKRSPQQLTEHLANHYDALTGTGREPNNFDHCLNYRPGQFTRLPHRYYQFRYSGVDFFALDSNTWNTTSTAEGFDQPQLDWLEQSLTRSWETPNTIGRIVYLHHSPYTTESSRWNQSETLWVRKHLRTVFNQVKTNIAEKQTNKQASWDNSDPDLLSSPVVDLVLSGHAHCLEHMQTLETESADAHIDWVVCGGSGASLRRQREAGSEVLENISSEGKQHTRVVASSKLYAGVHGRRSKNQVFHSFLRIEIQPHQLQKLLVRPFVVNKQMDSWKVTALKPIKIGQAKKRPPVFIRRAS